MRSNLVVLLDPGVQIRLQGLDRGVDLLAEGDAVELVEDRAVEPLADPVRLQAFGLRAPETVGGGSGYGIEWGGLNIVGGHGRIPGNPDKGFSGD
jgi:hypothetical protein